MMKRAIWKAGWLVLLAAACTLAGFAALRKGPYKQDVAGNGETNMVQIHVFNRNGELVGPIESPKLELSDAEWRRRLTPEQFQVLRSSATERPFCGVLLDNKTAGVYSCAGCG